MNMVMHAAEEYLLNSLWQAPVILLVAFLLARALRRLGPAAEHPVWVGALLAQVVLPACAAPGFLSASGILSALRMLLTAREPMVGGSVTFTLGGAKPLGGVTAFAFHTGVLLYGALTVALLLRFVWQCLQLRLLMRGAEPVVLRPEAATLLRLCCAQMHVAEVQVAQTPGARTPLTFGLLRPKLLLPNGLAERVELPELRAALLHELAHVARHDAAKQMAYYLLWLPVAYHPAVWLTMANMAETRERVCDRMAAAATGDARQYARSLLQLASLLTVCRPAQPHAIGLFDANQLERRILMLNRRSLPIARSARMALLAGSAAVAFAAGTSLLAMHLNVIAPSAKNSAYQVKVGSGVMAGMAVSRVMPVYPPDAKAAKIQGAVVLHAIIGKTGAVEQLTVVSGPTELQASALDAVRQWVYKPYLLNGQPTEVETTIQVNFSLVQ